MEAVVTTQCTRWGELGVFLMHIANGAAYTAWAGVAFEVQQSHDVFMISVLALWWYSILLWYIVTEALRDFPVLRNDCADSQEAFPVYFVYITFVYLTVALSHAIMWRGWGGVRWMRCVTVVLTAALVISAPVVTGNWTIHAVCGSAVFGIVVGAAFVILRWAFLEPYYYVLLKHPLGQLVGASYSEDEHDRWFF